MVMFIDHPDMTMSKTAITKLSVDKRRVSVDALVNLKTTSCHQLLESILRRCFSRSVPNG